MTKAEAQEIVKNLDSTFAQIQPLLQAIADGWQDQPAEAAKKEEEKPAES